MEKYNTIVKITKEEHITLDENQLISLFEDFIYKRILKVKRGAFLQNKKDIVYYESYHTSHSWAEKKKIRTATKTDIEMFKLLNILENITLENYKKDNNGK